jgi:anti-sigma B factor antagonist
MQISDESIGGVCVVTARGRLDGSASGPFGERVQALIGPDRPKLLIDFAGIDFVTSAGLRVFGIARKRMQENGGQLAFVNMQPQIEEVFEIIKALPGLDVFKNMAEFDSYLSTRQLRDRDDD